MSSNYNKHLSYDDRLIIEKGLTNGSSRKSISDTLGKDKSTICKEIKKHSFKKKYRPNKKGTYDCIFISDCGYNTFCLSPCNKFVKQSCIQRDKKMGVCNGCDSIKTCHLTKTIYEAKRAQKEYEYDLKDSRTGVNLTSKQAKQLGDKIKQLIDNGQSPYAVLQTCDDIDICEKTLYNYISNGVFSVNGLYDIDLRVKTKRKPTSTKKIKSKPRNNKGYLKGRIYDDYLTYMSNHPSSKIIEMDTVYNNESTGPFIQTFHFVKYCVMIGIFHKEKNASSMALGVNKLANDLGPLFTKLCDVILTDRGNEFTKAEEMEKLGIKVFYCDPMCSWQKPHCENNHRLLRYICPKEKDLYLLGLNKQEDLDLIFSHINSYPRKERFDKSPFEELQFYHKGIYNQILERLRLKKISKKDIILTPNLIKK